MKTTKNVMQQSQNGMVGQDFETWGWHQEWRVKLEQQVIEGHFRRSRKSQAQIQGRFQNQCGWRESEAFCQGVVCCLCQVLLSASLLLQLLSCRFLQGIFVFIALKESTQNMGKGENVQVMECLFCAWHCTVNWGYLRPPLLLHTLTCAHTFIHYISPMVSESVWVYLQPNYPACLTEEG